MALLAALLALSVPGPTSYVDQANLLKDKGMHELGAYRLLGELTGIGGRLSGSDHAAEAVVWAKATMEKLGFENVRLVPCMVPHWVRGDQEVFTIQTNGQTMPLTCCALGMSVATPPDGANGDVLEVGSYEEATKLGDKAKGKILFFNGPMDPTLIDTFGAYGRAGAQRFAGAALAGKLGAVAAVVRSLTLAQDDVPHTGVTGYGDSPVKVPAIAVSVKAADALHEALRAGPVTGHMLLNCQTLPDAPSANVIGELRGVEHPNEVVAMGGHLDSWDKGVGAHDDGAGVTQSLEALRLLKELGWKPRRTIRVVLFMNEENGGRGAAAYAAFAKASGEKNLAALESDSGGFAPRFFSSSLSGRRLKRTDSWLEALRIFEIERIAGGGGGGADVGDLAPLGTVLFGLEPESQRYFDYHHSISDTLDKVNPRELELGALSMAMLMWMASQDGV